MIEFVSLFLIAIGALLVSVASILRLAWLAVIIPMLIAGGAAYGLLVLRRRGPRRASRANSRPDIPEKSERMAA